MFDLTIPLAGGTKKDFSMRHIAHDLSRYKPVDTLVSLASAAEQLGIAPYWLRQHMRAHGFKELANGSTYVRLVDLRTLKQHLADISDTARRLCHEQIGRRGATRRDCRGDGSLASCAAPIRSFARSRWRAMTLVSDRDPAINLARPTRRRSTKAEVERRRARLLEIVEAMKPMTVRQVFYQATVRGLVEKSEAGYTKVQSDLVLMRRSGFLPYAWLADNTRWAEPTTFNGIEQALEATASSTARACGPMPTPMSRSGLRRTRSPAWSTPSPPCSTCH